MIQINETAARTIGALMAKQDIDEGGLRVGVNLTCIEISSASWVFLAN